MRQLREQIHRGEIYRDMIQFVATRLTFYYLDKIDFFYNTAYDMTMEDKKRAIEALLDLCVKKVLTYYEKGYSWLGSGRLDHWSSNWQRDEVDNLEKEFAALLSKTVKELARE